jgi:hypothetical protein
LTYALGIRVNLRQFLEQLQLYRNGVW